MDFFLFFLIPTAYHTMHCQNKLKIGYVLFWSYYGPGRLDLNRTSEGRPQDAVCRLGSILLLFMNLIPLLLHKFSNFLSISSISSSKS